MHLLVKICKMLWINVAKKNHIKLTECNIAKRKSKLNEHELRLFDFLCLADFQKIFWNIWSFNWRRRWPDWQRTWLRRLTCSVFVTRSQFHQHFTSAFFVQGALCSIALVTFGLYYLLAQKLCVKCWWNWHLGSISSTLFVQLLHLQIPKA